MAWTYKLAWDLKRWLCYLTRLVAEKTNVVSTKLYGLHADLVETYILGTMFHESHSTLSYERSEHYSQYIIIQTFTA